MNVNEYMNENSPTPIIPLSNPGDDSPAYSGNQFMPDANDETTNVGNTNPGPANGATNGGNTNPGINNRSTSRKSDNQASKHGNKNKDNP